MTIAANVCNSIIINFRMVRAVAIAAELQIMQLDEADPLRNLPNARERMDEFSYYHGMAAVLFEDSRDFLKQFGEGMAM